MRLYFLKENIKVLFYFIKWIPGYYKLHRDYGYEPDTYSYIIVGILYYSYKRAIIFLSSAVGMFIPQALFL